MRPIFSASMEESKNPALEGVGIKNSVGKKIDFSLIFKNEKGEKVSLSDYFKEKKPVLFSIVYYECPTLCNYHIRALLGTLKTLRWTVGRELQVVFLSMDHNEPSSLAMEKKETLLKEYSRMDGRKGFHLLTGDKDNIQKLANQLGFQFKWLESEKIFSHPSLTYVLTPEGKISQSLSGLSASVQDLKLALLEASQGKVGNIIERILLFCYRFDSKKNAYTLYAANVMKLAGGLTLFSLLVFLLLSFFVTEKKRKREANKMHKEGEVS